jgi:hypothetical protein
MHGGPDCQKLETKTDFMFGLYHNTEVLMMVSDSLFVDL